MVPSARVELHHAADPNTGGEVRIVVDGQPLGEVAEVGPAPARVVIALPSAASEVFVEARRAKGTGLVRVAALLDVLTTAQVVR